MIYNCVAPVNYLVINNGVFPILGWRHFEILRWWKQLGPKPNISSPKTSPCPNFLFLFKNYKIGNKNQSILSKNYLFFFLYRGFDSYNSSIKLNLHSLSCVFSKPPRFNNNTIDATSWFHFKFYCRIITNISLT